MLKTDPVPHHRAAPFGGFGLPRGRWGFYVAAGFPATLDARAGYGALNWLQIDLGYRSYLFLGHLPYVRVKLSVPIGQGRRHGFAVTLLGGAGLTERRYLLQARFFMGGIGPIGEAAVHWSSRWQAHGLLVMVGVRVGELGRYYRDERDDPALGPRIDRRWVVFGDVGWVVSLKPWLCHLLAIGAEGYAQTTYQHRDLDLWGTTVRARWAILFDL